MLRREARARQRRARVCSRCVPLAPSGGVQSGARRAERKRQQASAPAESATACRRLQHAMVCISMFSSNSSHRINTYVPRAQPTVPAGGSRAHSEHRQSNRHIHVSVGRPLADRIGWLPREVAVTDATRLRSGIQIQLKLYDTSCDIVKKVYNVPIVTHTHWYHITTYGRAFVLHGSRSEPATHGGHARSRTRTRARR